MGIQGCIFWGGVFNEGFRRKRELFLRKVVGIGYAWFIVGEIWWRFSLFNFFLFCSGGVT